MITLAKLRSASLVLWCFGLVLRTAVPAAAARHPFGTTSHDGPSVSIQIGRSHGNESLKTFAFPVRKSIRPASPAPDLPMFVNPLVRRHMALSPNATSLPIQAADAI